MKETLGEAPYIGQKVWIYKANMILPQIRRAEKDKGIPIFNRETKILCPACGEPINFLTSVDTGVMNAVCENPQCSGKLINRLDHYLGIKGLNVKGISKATLEKLIDWGYIKEMKDIYELEKYRTEWESKPGFGRASVGKILEAIDTTGRRPQLDSFIAAIGIPLVGKAVAGSICKYYASWTDFREAVGGDWETLEGFGPEISRAINTFDYTEADYIVEHYISFEEMKKSKGEKASSLEGKVFVITGKLKSFKNRDELKDSIESLGGKVTGSVSAKTDYLINNDIESTSAKNRRAKELGVSIITESEYLVMIGEL
jgi:DNA ligase (NAD+)